METLVWGCIGLFCFCLILFTKYRSKAKEYDSMVFMKDEYLSKWRDCQEKYHACQEKYHTCQEEYDRMVSMKDEYLSKWRDCQERYDHLEEQTRVLQKELDEHKTNLQIVMESNLTSIPWLAGMISDFLTLDLEMEARKLDWGNNVQRAKKVASLREIRADVKKRIEEAKEATYQLEYLRKVFPEIDDVITTDYRDLQFSANLSEHDPVRNYLSREEFLKLSEDERNQLALDRYIASRMKSKWQIGRDYELSV